MAIQQSIDSAFERHMGPHGASEKALKPALELAKAALDEASLGELLMHFMLETIIAVHFLGVDAFDRRRWKRAKC
jgi:hypothetical protein